MKTGGSHGHDYTGVRADGVGRVSVGAGPCHVTHGDCWLSGFSGGVAGRSSLALISAAKRRGPSTWQDPPA
jgi:hypothetical protein